MKTIFKYPVTITAIMALLAIMAVTAHLHGRERTAKASDPQAKAALLEALAGPEGEYAAAALSSAVLAQFGAVQPYASMNETERRHIRLLKRQLKQRGIAIPADSFAGRIEAPKSLAAAARSGVQCKEKNRALYDRLLASVKDDADLTRLFRRVQWVSREAHLPALQAALENAQRVEAAQRRTQPQDWTHDCRDCGSACWDGGPGPGHGHHGSGCGPHH